jgi:hypothetical protein
LSIVISILSFIQFAFSFSGASLRQRRRETRSRHALIQV